MKQLPQHHRVFDVAEALDLLQARMENGAKIVFQDNEWWLFESDGEGICGGKTIREMLVNLIFTDC